MIAPTQQPDPDDEPKVDVKAVVYALHMRGKTNKEIAEALDLTPGKVSRWVNAAYEKGLMDKLPHPREFGTRLVCTCAENPLSPDGAPIVCVVCDRSSHDYHPRMHAGPLPEDRRYKPGKLKGGSGDSQAEQEEDDHGR